jgi:hypothetical protein
LADELLYFGGDFSGLSLAHPVQNARLVMGVNEVEIN